MASRALELTTRIEFDQRPEQARITKFFVLAGQRAGVFERDGVVVGQVGAYQRRADRDGRYSAFHNDVAGLAENSSQSDGTVVATEAKQ